MRDGSGQKGRVLRIALAAVVAAGVVAGMGGSAQALAAGHARRAPVSNVSFSRVSCRGKSFCLAVGQYSVPGHPEVRLTEEWNGKVWRILPDSLPGVLHNVTCGSPSFCLAGRAILTGKGTARIYLTEWNGRSWQKFKHEAVNDYAVSCGAGSFCVTPDKTYSYIQGWNGKNWQDLSGSFCGLGPDCRWTGASCGSATNCAGYGTVCEDSDCDSTESFNAVWDGTTWSFDVTDPVYSAAGACAGASFCLYTAPPASATFTRDWWKTWHDASPDLTTACHGLANCSLDGQLACGSAWSCLDLPASATSRAVSLAWNGTTWTATRVALVNGQIPDLTTLSCGSAGNCLAVGTYRLGQGKRQRPVAEHWNGSTWQVTPLPLP